MVATWLTMPGRYNFLNLSRYSTYSDKSIRLQFRRRFNFFYWMHGLCIVRKSTEQIIAFDPTYVPKSGKQTFGLGKFWSGKDQQAKKGLEFSCLAVVDVVEQTAYHLEAVQTPAHMQGKLIDHYVSIIMNRITDLLTLSRYLVVDGYFMKKKFIKPLLKAGLHIITKMRPDANLQYLYKGPQKKGRGRKRKVAGKINVKQIDKTKWKKCYEDDSLQGYELIVWCVTLKAIVKAVYLQSKHNPDRHEIIISTDIKQKAKQIIHYYRLRFQIEFLIRDAKQHAGLEHCQARSQEKLYNHVNLSISTVSVAKQMFWSSLPDKQQVPFSMHTIKMRYYNKYIADLIFSNLGVDLNCKKIKQLFNQCVTAGGIAA